MNEKRECKIVQDLLPNYIEKVTVKETNDYIENHLKTCKECQKVYSSMTENLDSKFPVEEKEVKYMKKFQKQLKVLKIVVLFIFLCFAFSIGSKTYILCLLGHKWEKTQKDMPDNYYVKSIRYGEGSIYESICYAKGQDYINTENYINCNGEKSKTIHYRKGTEFLHLSETNEKKIQYKTYYNIIPFHLSVASDNSSYFWGNLQTAPFVKIENISIDNKECYVIKYSNEDRIIDKETGIMIKTIHYENSGITITENYYEFGNVQDSDIERPDTTGYVMYDETNLP